MTGWFSSLESERKVTRLIAKLECVGGPLRSDTENQQRHAWTELIGKEVGRGLTLIISDIPKESEPMKSFREVRSQSQTSINRRRSLSSAFSSLQEANWGDNRGKRMRRGERGRKLHLQGNRLVPNWIQSGPNGLGFLLDVVPIGK